MSRSQQPNRTSSQRYSPTSPNRFSWTFSVPVHSTSEILRFSGLVVNTIAKSSVPVLWLQLLCNQVAVITTLQKHGKLSFRHEKLIFLLVFVTGIRQLSLLSNDELFLCDSGDEIRPISARCNIQRNCDDSSDERNCEKCKKSHMNFTVNQILGWTVSNTNEKLDYHNTKYM